MRIDHDQTRLKPDRSIGSLWQIINDPIVCPAVMVMGPRQTLTCSTDLRRTQFGWLVGWLGESSNDH